MFFFWCEASNLLFLKVTAKMYHLFSGWKTKQKEVDIILFSADMRKLFVRHRIVMQRYYYRETDSYKPWLLSGSLHILSFCMLFTDICLYVYMLYLYSPFFFFPSNPWIWITVHVNSRLQSIMYRQYNEEVSDMLHHLKNKKQKQQQPTVDYTWIHMFKPTLLSHKTTTVCSFRTS